MKDKINHALDVAIILIIVFLAVGIFQKLDREKPLKLKDKSKWYNEKLICINGQAFYEGYSKLAPAGKRCNVK